VSFQEHRDELNNLLNMFNHSAVTEEIQFLHDVAPNKMIEGFRRAVVAVQHSVIVTTNTEFLPMHNNLWTVEYRETGGNYYLRRAKGTNSRWNDNSGELEERDDESMDVDRLMNGTLW